MKLKFPPESECKFSLAVDYEDIPVRGNALASGDDAEDKRCEDEIIARLNDCDVWAWAFVTVTCQWNGFEGRASLGCCSYRDEADFCAPGGYFDDMKTEAYERMCAEMQGQFKRLLPLLR